MKNLIKTLHVFLFLILGTNLLYAETELDVNTLNIIKESVESYLQAKASQDVKVSAELISVPKKLDRITLPLTVSSRKQGMIIGKSVFSISCVLESGLEKSFIVTANVKCFSTVTLANKIIERNEIITQNDLYSEIRQITASAHDMPVSILDSVNKRATRRIQKDHIITDSMIEEPPLVDFGKQIKLIVVSKNVSIEIPVTSLEPGNTGDVIKVRDLSQSTFYFAQIIDENTARFKSKTR